MGVELTAEDLDRLTTGAPSPERVVELLSDVFVGFDPDEPATAVGEEAEVA